MHFIFGASLIILSMVSSPVVCKTPSSENLNYTVIGVLSQEYIGDAIEVYFKGHKSYIAASYVKAVEASGAMVVPIKIGQNQEYYEHIMSRINGLVIPGGAAYFNYTNGYKDAGKTLIHIAEKMNQRGEHFPILGVCLGFELLLFVANKEKELRSKCNVFNEELSLRFAKNGSKTGIYKTFPKKNLKALSNNPITFNYHIWCVTKSTMKETKLSDSWTILAESKSNKSFVATVQSKQFPFVGIQFHPEKSAFEWNTHSHINHSRIAIETSRLFYDWLVVEAGKSTNSFSSKADLYSEIIYNYPAIMTYSHNELTSFEQIYFFD